MILFKFALFFVGGVLLYRFPPSMNSFIGYRTKRASKDTKTWYYAQKTAGKLAIVFSFISVALEVMNKNLYMNQNLYTFIDGSPVWLGILIVVITEFRLYKKEKKNYKEVK